MSIVFIDADSELPYEKVKELNFSPEFIIKMPYTICDQEVFSDLGPSYNAKEFFSLVKQGNMPITSGLNKEIYLDYFEKYFAQNEDILYVSFSSQMSGTFVYHDQAIEELRTKYPLAKYRRYDTKGISMATGLPCYYAVKMHNEGKTNDEICAFLDSFVPRVSVCFSPSNLFYLKKGGRLSTVEAIIGTMMQIKPIIRLSDEGKLYSAGKVNGRNKALNTLADEVISRVRDIERYPIVVVNGDCHADAERVITKIRAAYPSADIWDYDIGPVIGTHCGPDTIGCIYVSDCREV